MAEQEQALEIENQDDIALVKRMQDGRDQIVAEIKKVIVGRMTSSMSYLLPCLVVAMCWSQECRVLPKHC